MKRRDFVSNSLGVGAALSLFPAALGGLERVKRPGGIELRALGKTGEKLSMLGFGGVVVMNATAEQAAANVRRAIDSGVNYFDVAPTYGNAEDMLGPALAPFRKDVFLACKTQKRTKNDALAELESSLTKMRTDYFDLYQHHAVTKKADVETIFGPGGAMEAFEAARKAGKARFLGFSAHSVEAAMALMDGYAFDTLLFPFNYAIWHAGGFGPQVMAEATKQGMGILCLKSMAKGPWPDGSERRYKKCWYEPVDDPREAEKALRFTLSHPVTAAIPPGDEGLFRMALELGARFTPLTTEEADAMKVKGMKQTPLFRFPSPEA
jgi:predicted aldo/keto reductase-like oxidoreductase